MLAHYPKTLDTVAMYTTHKTQLPESHHGDDRYFSTGFTIHGDVLLGAWRGDESDDVDDNPSLHRYQLAHGGEPYLLGAMIGHRTVIGHAEETIRRDFRDAAKEILSEERPGTHIATIALAAARGTTYTHYSRPQLGWRARVVPLATEPGSHHYGVGLFSADNEERDFVIANTLDLEPHLDNLAQEAASATCFTPEDIKPMAQVVCRAVLGDYRDQVRQLLERRFPA